MTTRGLTSPATRVVVAVVSLALLMAGGAAVLRHVRSSDHSTASATGPDRVAHVPATAAGRRAIRVLSNGCRYDERGIPQCGTLLGAAYGSDTDPTSWEHRMGHQLGVHRTYFSAAEVDEAVATARTDLQHQRIPWISFTTPDSWSEMATGSGDSWARDLATRLGALDGPVWVAIAHEPEGDGDIQAWTAMQARLAPIVRAAAPNVAYSLILTGWNQFYGSKEFSLDAMWPSGTTIDLLGFDVYNKYGVVKHGQLILERTKFKTDYFEQFEKFAAKHGVAWGLAETGYTDLAAQGEPQFVKHLYNSVRKHRGVAMAYFNSSVHSVAPWRLEGRKSQEFATTLRTTPTL
jgi:hypothetical protein